MTRAASKRCQRWSDADVARLRLEYPHAPNPELAASLGRSEATVYQKAKALGLRKAVSHDRRFRQPAKVEYVSFPAPAIRSPIDVFLYRTPSPFPVEFS